MRVNFIGISGMRRLRPAFWPDHDRHLPVEPMYAAQQPFQRELVQPASQQRGHIRLLETEKFGCLGLGELAVLENVANLADQLRLQFLFLGIIETEVGEDVSAAALHGDFAGHLSISFI